jgi:hypothetical protein
MLNIQTLKLTKYIRWLVVLECSNACKHVIILNMHTSFSEELVLQLPIIIFS